LSTGAADALLTYDWPVNVHELERVVERAVALASGSSLELDDLPPARACSASEVRGDRRRAAAINTGYDRQRRLEMDLG
jgi:DNA-binding NtrC family response regulator